MESLHFIGDIISERYKILAILGQGGTGWTYQAQNLNNQQIVAIKAMSLRHMRDWKALELFEREAKILEKLNHEFIPAYLDYFYTDTSQDRCFYLVQEFISGESLGNRVKKGWIPTEEEFISIARQILIILSYLHSFNPPVIHRDIKPENLIYGSTGKVWLVDFGSVQDVYRHTISRSGTFVGTLGYIPPEQFRGQVLPASDLYALGATLIFLLTRQTPDELPYKRGKLNFRSRVSISEHLVRWLECLVEPVIEDRFQSSGQALKSLFKEPSKSETDIQISSTWNIILGLVYILGNLGIFAWILIWPLINPVKVLETSKRYRICSPSLVAENSKYQYTRSPHELEQVDYRLVHDYHERFSRIRVVNIQLKNVTSDQLLRVRPSRHIVNFVPVPETGNQGAYVRFPPILLLPQSEWTTIYALPVNGSICFWFYLEQITIR